jgi:hypothetical protein
MAFSFDKTWEGIAEKAKHKSLPFVDIKELGERCYARWDRIGSDFRLCLYIPQA